MLGEEPGSPPVPGWGWGEDVRRIGVGEVVVLAEAGFGGLVSLEGGEHDAVGGEGVLGVGGAVGDEDGCAGEPGCGGALGWDSGEQDCGGEEGGAKQEGVPAG